MSRVYVDMDGFLANLNKTFAPAFSLKYPEDEVLGYDWLMVKANVTTSEFFQIMEDNCDLWEKVEPYPWTSQLIQLLDLKAPQWMILTTATLDPACWRGKVEWLQRYLARDSVSKLVLIGGDKGRIASRGDILIDDGWHNVESWKRGGGIPFHWLDYSENMVSLAARQIERLADFLDLHLGLATFSSERRDAGDHSKIVEAKIAKS